MKLRIIAAFLAGAALATAAIAVATQVSGTLTVSCNSDGTMNVGTVAKP